MSCVNHIDLGIKRMTSHCGRGWLNNPWDSRNLLNWGSLNGITESSSLNFECPTHYILLYYCCVPWRQGLQRKLSPPNLQETFARQWNNLPNKALDFFIHVLTMVMLTTLLKIQHKWRPWYCLARNNILFFSSDYNTFFTFSCLIIAQPGCSQFVPSITRPD